MGSHTGVRSCSQSSAGGSSTGTSAKQVLFHPLFLILNGDRMECAHQKYVLAEKLLSVNLSVLYLSILVGLIWKGDVETANLSDILKRAISAWSSIKYFATCAKETVGSFSRRKLPLCRGKTHLAAKCRNGDRSSRGGSWVKSDLQSNMINKVIYFSYVCMQGFLWFCFKALFVFPSGVEGNLV